MTPPIEGTRRLLAGFDPGGDAAARRHMERARRLLDGSGDPFSRHNYTPGHVTASGLVIAPDGEAVLLVYHRRLGRWLQPGGHVDPKDSSLADTARREVIEETGVALANGEPALILVHVHEIPPGKGEPGHWHHDFMFRFAAASRRLRPGPRQARWVEAGDVGEDDVLVRALRRAL